MLHFVRHGEVHNPANVVYADLPGFDLSDLGRRQAEAAAERLADCPVVGVWASPLLRALRTAEPIAAAHRLPVRVDDGLVEWGLASRWAGVGWDHLDDPFPGELGAYLEHPDDLPFSPESLDALAERVSAVAERLATDHGDVVLVSHQDPIHAAVRRLTGAGFAAYHEAKPGHAEIISLRPEADRWERR